jgi:hypothetical protein
MTYGRETRDTKKAVRERVNSTWEGKVARRLHRKSTTVGRMIKKLYDDDMSLSP